MSRLKDFVESNPLIVLLAACSTVATAAVGVDSYFWTRQIDQAKHQHEVAQQELSATLHSRIFDLEQRLVSIERRVEGEKLYIDVAKIPILPHEMSSVGLTHQAYAEGKFFVAPPSFGGWEETAASQLDFLPYLLGDELAAAFRESVRDVAGIDEKVGFLWTSAEETNINVPDAALAKQFGADIISLRPFIYAMPVDQNTFKVAANVISRLAGDLFSGADDNAGKMAEGQVLQQTDDLKEALQTKSLNPDEVLSVLDRMSRKDLAGFILHDALAAQDQYCVQLLGGSLHVVSADKKGNVVYLRFHCIIRSDQDDAQVTLDQEYFFIGTQQGGILVRSFVPAVSFRSPAYAWTQAWLTSLRVPLI